MNNDKDCLIGADVGLQQSHMMEVRDKEQPWLKKIEINRNNIQTNKQLSLIGAVVGLQQSHMNEQERQRASLDWNNQDKLEQSHIWRGDKETASIETAGFNLSQFLVLQFNPIRSKVNKLVFVSKKG